MSSLLACSTFCEGICGRAKQWGERLSFFSVPGLQSPQEPLREFPLQPQEAQLQNGHK